MIFFVQGIGDAIGSAITNLIIIAVIGIVAIFSWIGYGTYKFINNKNETIIESNHIIKPTTKLHTDGTTIDTIYVYTFKK